MKGNQRVASRFLLPLEMFLGLNSIAWGLSGAVGHGPLWHLIDGGNLAWGWALGGLGLLRFAIAATEWSIGRNWLLCSSPPTCHWSIHRSVSVRATLSFVAVSVWIYVMKTLLEAGPEALNVLSLCVTAPCAAAFSWWTFVENLKVRYALDPRYETRALRFHR